MSYLRFRSDQEITPEMLKKFIHLLGLNIPAEDLESLASLLGNQLMSVSKLDQLDLTDLNPILEMDPRWYE